MPAIQTKKGPDQPGSPRALPDFIAEVRASAEFAAGVRAALATMPSGLDPEVLFETAQAVFEADVARNRDIANHVKLRRVRQNERLLWHRDRNLELRRAQFEFKAVDAIREHLAEIKKIDDDRSLPNYEKVNAIRRCLFGEPPENNAPPVPPGVTIHYPWST